MHGSVSRRTVSVAAAGSFAALLAGCGSSGGKSSGQSATGPVAEPKKPVTVSFASWVGSEKGMKRLYKRFRQEHPKISVEFQNIPAERAQEKLTTQIAGGNPPDCAYIDASAVASFASRKALVNLDGYLKYGKIVDSSDFVPAFRTFVEYEGGLYGLPFDGESTGLFYRTDLFQQAGIKKPPATWEEFEAAAEELTDPGAHHYGYQLFAPEAAYYWYPWLWQAGGTVLSKDLKKVTFNSAPGKEAAEFYVGLKKYSAPDYLNSNSYDGRVAFAHGQVAMYMAGAWLAGVLDDEFPDIKGKWAVAPLPEGKAGPATSVAGDSLVLFSSGKHADAAWKWIEFLCKPENIAEWTYKSEGTLLPPLQHLLDSPDLVKEKPVLKSLAASMKYGVSQVVTHPAWPQMEEALTKQLGKAIYGETSASKALDAAADEAQKLLDD